jgi:Bacterial regulatory proteins, luxR family
MRVATRHRDATRFQCVGVLDQQRLSAAASRGCGPVHARCSRTGSSSRLHAGPRLSGSACVMTCSPPAHGLAEQSAPAPPFSPAPSVASWSEQRPEPPTREIAQEVFVTPGTIELHLTNAYRELNIEGRSQRVQALSQ